MSGEAKATGAMLDMAYALGAGAAEPRLAAALARVAALEAERDQLRERLTDMLGWFVHGDADERPMSVSELILPGCPNDLRASLFHARAALAGRDGGA